MSRRHAAQRRRSYGRRQHEVHERERVIDEPLTDDTAEGDAAPERSTTAAGPRAIEPSGLHIYEHPAARALFARIRGDVPKDPQPSRLDLFPRTRATSR